jgi:hypothetical protein
MKKKNQHVHWSHFYITYRYVADIHGRTGIKMSQPADDGNAYTPKGNNSFAISSLQRDGNFKMNKEKSGSVKAEKIGKCLGTDEKFSK